MKTFKLLKEALLQNINEGIFPMVCDHCGTEITQPVFRNGKKYGYSCARKLFGKDEIGKAPPNMVKVDKVERGRMIFPENSNSLEIYNSEKDGDIKEWHNKINNGEEGRLISAHVIHNNVNYFKDNIILHNGEGYMNAKHVTDHINAKIKKSNGIVKNGEHYDNLDKIKNILQPYHSEMKNMKEYKAITIPLYDTKIKNYREPLSPNDIFDLHNK